MLPDGDKDRQGEYLFTNKLVKQFNIPFLDLKKISSVTELSYTDGIHLTRSSAKFVLQILIKSLRRFNMQNTGNIKLETPPSASLGKATVFLQTITKAYINVGRLFYRPQVSPSRSERRGQSEKHFCHYSLGVSSSTRDAAEDQQVSNSTIQTTAPQHI
jgi:hypothetical protein